MILAMDCNNERFSKKYIFDTEFENLYYFVEKCSLYLNLHYLMLLIRNL